jgi:hypothetical protein
MCRLFLSATSQDHPPDTSEAAAVVWQSPGAGRGVVTKPPGPLARLSALLVRATDGPSACVSVARCSHAPYASMRSPLFV